MRSSVHTHSVFCDGENTIEEMARAAAELGIKTLGCSGHSYDPTGDYGIRAERMPAYRAEVARVAELYRGRLTVLCGLELDSLTPDDFPLTGLDYVIGSVHSVRGADGTPYAVDDTPEILRAGIERGFGGDALALTAGYYAALAAFCRQKKPDIVGHFDLVTKFNGKFGFFDEDDPRYRNAALASLDAVLETDAVIEVNTGAIGRGWRNSPYPAEFLLRHIAERRGRVVITTDCHRAELLDAFVSDAERLLLACGVQTVYELTADGFVGRKLRF